ncbi:MAG: C1 family peptidase [Clostridiales bacterium]|nr:C1 family peptidase [Clostridiales bacterium]
MVQNITEQFLESCSENFNNIPQNRLMMNAVIKVGIDEASISNQSIIDNQFTFSNEIGTGKVANQKLSGRCWMFAGLNLLRQRIIEKYNIKDFELSQCYTMFWDKLEKSNYFLESIIDTLEKPLDSRLVMWLLSNPIQDGGQWDMFANIVEKYGVLPKYMMPETFHSSSSSKMNSLLALKLRQGALTLRKLHEGGASVESIRNEKEKILGEVYNMLCCFLGEPPKKFDFEYKDADGKFHRRENLTSLKFYSEFVDINIRDYVSIINAPTADKKFNTAYTVAYLGNVKGGKDIKYLNVDVDTLKELAIKQLQDNQTVWFGCDVGKLSDQTMGIMDDALYNYDDVLGTNLELSKGERLDYGESCLTHAMVLTGVNIYDGKPNRWKVENSWGDGKGDKGYFVMSDSWFEKFTYQIVTNKKYLSKELSKAYEKEPQVLNPWDPMGSLAVMK